MFKKPQLSNSILYCQLKFKTIDKVVRLSAIHSCSCFAMEAIDRDMPLVQEEYMDIKELSEYEI